MNLTIYSKNKVKMTHWKHSMIWKRRRRKKSWSRYSSNYFIRSSIMKMEMKESRESAGEACLRKELKHMKSFPLLARGSNMETRRRKALRFIKNSPLLVKGSRTMVIPQKKELRHIKSYKSSARRRLIIIINQQQRQQNNVNASHGPWNTMISTRKKMLKLFQITILMMQKRRRKKRSLQPKWNDLKL